MIKKNKIIGLILIIIGLSLPGLMYVNDKKEKMEEIIIVENKIKNKEEYFAIIEIDKINLKRELYEIGDERNNVNQNILVHESSVFPNDEKSNIILASHSGSGSNAYFKYLYKLNVNDKVKIYYNDKIYEYVIKEIEYQDKMGKLYLKNNYKEMLTLITCTYRNNKTQTIYYGILENIQKISEN